MKVRTMGMVIGAAAVAIMAARGNAAPDFAKKPVVSKDGAGCKIEFAAAAPTDCAVYVLDAQGKTVRHLAAGALGDKAPEPLKPGLAQSLVWDGKDDLGKPAAGGPFKVRVGLGLQPRFDRTIGFNPAALPSVRALAVGPKGELFAFFCFGTIHPSDNSMACSVFSRDGQYLRTIMPYPANLPAEKLKGVKQLELENGVKAPFIYQAETRSLIPGASDIENHEALATSDGRVAFVGRLEYLRYAQPGIIQMVVLNADGSVPDGGPLKTRIFENGISATLAMSPDEKTLYASDVRTAKGHYGIPVNVVYKFGWDDKEARPFLGGKAATGELALNDPKGICTDKEGNLFIADKGNDRVAIFKPDGSFLAALKTTRPERVAVNHKTGAIYVLGGSNINQVLKFNSCKDGAPAAKTSITYQKHEGYRVSMTMDDSAEPAVLWLGGHSGYQAGFNLLRIEDKGAAFGQPSDIAKLPANTALSVGAVLDVNLDRSRERVCINWAGAFDGRTGERKGDGLPRAGDSEGVTFGIGLDGLYYMQSKNPMGVLRFDANTFKPIPFGDSKAILRPGSLRLRGRGVTSDAQGNVYHIWQKNSADVSPGDFKGSQNHALGKWGPDGKAIDEKLIDADIRSVNSPRIDYQGNIYLLAGLRPGTDRLPPGLKGKLPDGDKDPDAVCGVNFYPLIYGSVVKFGPEGGLIRKGSGGVTCNYNFAQTTDVKGAKWIVPGASVVPSWRSSAPYFRPDICLCESPRFDVDGFGRSFYPDAGRFRVGVLDTAGNAICTFGGYGNQDSGGAGSAVPVPDIPFCWVQAVAVGDEAAYVGDRLNRRVVRVKLGYAAEESCPIGP